MDDESFPMTEGEARECAQVELLGNPALVTEWLAGQCANVSSMGALLPQWQQMRKGNAHHGGDPAAAVVMFAMMVGRAEDAALAVIALRELMINSHADWLEHRARAIFNFCNGIPATQTH